MTRMQQEPKIKSTTTVPLPDGTYMGTWCKDFVRFWDNEVVFNVNEWSNFSHRVEVFVVNNKAVVVPI